MSGSAKAGIATAPPIPEHRKSVYEYYRLTFDEAGCPMKQTDSGMVFHPILAAYLIFEYVQWYELERDALYLEHALRIAKLALARAEIIEDALVFYYRPETKLSSIPTTFYSALTQAWYIFSLTALRPHALELFDSSIKAIFQSLMIPVERGGCFICYEWGWVVEEYPNDPPLYTLNGWLTVIKMVADCKATLKAVGIDSVRFLSENLRAVKRLLPLYDAGFCYNSRYQLTGFTRVKLVFDKPPIGVLESFAVEIPGCGIYEGSLQKGNSRWKYYLERDEGRIKQFNILLSLVSHPSPNVFRLSYKTNHEYKVTLMIAQGAYDPHLSGMPTQSWKTVGEFEVGLDAPNIIVELPWDEENLFAYPTNFKKKLDGRYFNAYHYIHISDLAWLFAYTKDPAFKEQALKWLKYADQWPNVIALQQVDISHHPQNSDKQGFKKLLGKIFEKPVETIEI